MIRLLRLPVMLLTATLCAALADAQSPAGFGTRDYTVTVVAAPAFMGASFNISGSLGRFGSTNVDQHFYAALDIPAGATIDYIGVNNINDTTPGVITATLWHRFDTGALNFWGSVSNTPHGTWSTDLNASPIGITWQGHGSGFDGQGLLLDVEIASSPNLQFFGWVEVWWKRTVSPPPGFASFNDVPTSHPLFQYIEALRASGITGGCQASPPLYCPDHPVTRGQIAVFLAKALGLHWPY
jgi:S-layer homology domain